MDSTTWSQGVEVHGPFRCVGAVKIWIFSIDVWSYCGTKAAAGAGTETLRKWVVPCFSLACLPSVDCPFRGMYDDGVLLFATE
jgi:hypothetical protein